MIPDRKRATIERMIARMRPAGNRVWTSHGWVRLHGGKIIEERTDRAPWQFDRVVVINRPDRTDRREQLETHLREIAWPFAAPQWHAAMPGHMMPPPPPEWRSTRNIWANLQSHLQILREAYASGAEHVLIMEDDCLYMPDFLPRVRRFLCGVPDDWGMLYLGGRFADYTAARSADGGVPILREHWGGGELRAPQRQHLGDGIHRVCGLNNLESYAVSRRFMPEAIRVLESTRFHSDVALNLVQWDAPTYHMLPPLAAQRAGFSDNFGVDKQCYGRIAQRRDEGAVILSCGDARRSLMANAAASFRRNHPHLSLHLVSDRKWRGYDCTLVEGGVDFDSRKIKTRLLAEPPFAKGVMLDDDTITLRPLPEFDALLGGCDLALTRDRYGTMRTILARPEGWLTQAEIDHTLEYAPEENEPHFNTGVIVYRDTPAVREFARVWHEEWMRFGRVDQMAFFRAMRRTGIRVAELPDGIHRIVETGRAPQDTYISHIIGRKWDLPGWLKENDLPIVPVPAEHKDCGACGGAVGAEKPEQWGPRKWRTLHRRPWSPRFNPDTEPRWLHRFALTIPCGECRAHFDALLDARPPQMQSARAYHDWTVAIHNDVNRMLGKPEFKPSM